MARNQEDTPKQVDTFLKKGNRKVVVMGMGDITGYTKVLLPFTELELSRARTNDRLGVYDAVEKTHAKRTNDVHPRVCGTILNVANGNLFTKAFAA